jgi:threonine synthase
MGSPIGPVVLASNANPTLKEWSETGEYRPRPSVATIANAMDVGNPSNFERLRALPEALRKVSVERVTDDEIRARIVSEYRQTGYVWCPHSATAAEAWWRLSKSERDERTWIAAATAHPYKFADIVEPLVGRSIEPSPALAAILERPSRKSRISADLGSLADGLRERVPPPRAVA